MRLGQLVFGIAIIGTLMALYREPIGRVFIIVFFTGLGEIVFGMTSLMALFQTVGAIGEADSISSHLEALLQTLVVLTIATAIMSGWLFAGAWLIQIVV
jgi:hypothetical protein